MYLLILKMGGERMGDEFQPAGMAQAVTRKQNELWTRNYILIWFAALFLFMSFDSMMLVLPLYMELHAGLSGAAGYPMAALTLGALLIRPFAGWALDVYGRRSLFFAGLFLFLLPTLLYIGMLPAWYLIFLRFIQGIGFGISNTALFTIASDIIPAKSMGTGMGYFTATMALSTATSPAASSWILNRTNYPTIFTVAALLIVACMVLAALLKYPHFTKKEEQPRFVFLSTAGLKAAVVMLMAAFSFSSMMSFLPVYAVNQGVANPGIFFTAMALTSLVARPFAGMLVDRLGKRGYDMAVVIGVTALLAATLLLARTSSSLHLIIGGIIYGIGMGILQPTMLALSVRGLPPEKRGAANATYWNAFDAGTFIGSICWGPVAALLGYGPMFHLTMIFPAAGLLIYFLTRGQGRKEKLSGGQSDGSITTGELH